MKFTSALALCLAIADGYAPGITPPNPSRGGKRTVSVLGTSAKRPQRPHHRLLFVADDGVHGPELWVTEGTAATTHMIADIDPSPPHFDMDRCLNTFYVDEETCNYLSAFSCIDYPSEFCTDGGSSISSFIAYAGETYFIANDGTTGNELWRTDGTTAERVTDIAPAGLSSFEWLDPGNGEPATFHLIVYDGALYMRASKGTRGGITNQRQFGLYRYTPKGGVEHIADLPGLREGVHGWFAVMGGQLYFSGSRPSDGYDEVFAYTTGGTPLALGIPYQQDGEIHTLIATSQAVLFNGQPAFYGYRADTGLTPIEVNGAYYPKLRDPIVFSDEVCSVMAGTVHCFDGSPTGIRRIGPDLGIGDYWYTPVILGKKLYFEDLGVWVTDGNSPARPLGFAADYLAAHAGAVYGSCWDDFTGYPSALCRFLDGTPPEVVDTTGFYIAEKVSVPGTPLLAYSGSAPDTYQDQLRVYNASTGSVEHIVINPAGSARAYRFFAVEE